jgi:hypothetical protein
VLLIDSSGCALRINAGFPEVPVVPVANQPNSVKIGIARVEDNRASRDAGTINSNVTLLVGPELPDYLEHQFRNQLAILGIAAVDALNPAKTQKPPDYKTIVITLQSASFTTPDSILVSADASVNIAIQLYATSSANVAFAGSFTGTNEDRIGFNRGTGVTSGGILAVAADRAIDAAFADPKFQQALK